MYLYVDQLAELTPWSADRIRHMIKEGVFVEGVHYFRPRGKRPVFKWRAIEEYVEGATPPLVPQHDVEMIDDETRQARALLN